jgi:hypothetical protein
MLIDTWFKFAYAFAGFACGLFFLFEGTRRISVNGLHRRAAVIAGVGAVACLLYVAGASWLNSTFRQIVHAPIYAIPKEIADGWGSNMAPEKREEYSLMLARELFNQSGTFRDYFDRDGVRKRYSPTEQDIKDRDSLRAYGNMLDILARVSWRDAVVLLELMLAAIVGGWWSSRARVK